MSFSLTASNWGKGDRPKINTAQRAKLLTAVRNGHGAEVLGFLNDLSGELMDLYGLCLAEQREHYAKRDAA